MEKVCALYSTANDLYDALSQIGRRETREEVPGATVYVNFPLHVVTYTTREAASLHDFSALSSLPTQCKISSYKDTKDHT